MIIIPRKVLCGQWEQLNMYKEAGITTVPLSHGTRRTQSVCYSHSYKFWYNFFVKLKNYANIVKESEAGTKYKLQNVQYVFSVQFLLTYRQSSITHEIWVVTECNRICLSETLRPVVLRQNTTRKIILATNVLHFSFPPRFSTNTMECFASCSGLHLSIQHTSTAHSLHCRNRNTLLLFRIRASSVNIWLSSLRFSWILTWLKLLAKLFLLTRFAPLYANFQANSGVFLRLRNLSYLLLSIGCAFPTHLFLELCV